MNSKNDIQHPLKISIITVCFNAENLIEKTILSVLNQQYSNIEYIIIDGLSTDNTLKTIDKYKNNINTIISEPDSGIYDAMNKGIKKSSGDIIGILNAGDEYKPNIFETIVRLFQNKLIELVHGNMEIYYNNSPEKLIVKGSHIDLTDKQTVNHPTCFVRKGVYNKIGLFSTKYKIASDYDFLLRCKENNINFHYTDKVLVSYLRGGKSASCKTDLEVFNIKKEHHIKSKYISLWRWFKCVLKRKIQHFSSKN